MKLRVPRAETSTIVVVASGAALEDVHMTLDTLVRTSGVRPIVVTLGTQVEPRRFDRHGTTVIEGLVPRYLNNAVASLRLSSLPALAWWREPSTDGLSELAELVDRVVLDVEDPRPLWHLVPQLAGRTAVSDLRWARLTRWRHLFAQFFDLPDVLERARDFSNLEITAGDPHIARLLAGWITSRLPGGEPLDVAILPAADQQGIRSVRVTGGETTLSLGLLPTEVCIETIVTLPGAAPSRRVVAAGDERLAMLMSEELRVRSRDVAFEDAVAAAGGMG